MRRPTAAGSHRASHWSLAAICNKRVGSVRPVKCHSAVHRPRLARHRVMSMALVARAGRVLRLTQHKKFSTAAYDSGCRAMLSSEQLAFYDSNGYVVLPEFKSGDATSLLRSRISDLVYSEVTSDTGRGKRTVFSTVNRAHGNDSYFLESGDKIRGRYCGGRGHPRRM